MMEHRGRDFLLVIPAKAGIQCLKGRQNAKALDPRLRGDDGRFRSGVLPSQSRFRGNDDNFCFGSCRRSPRLRGNDDSFGAR
jgi:hypothetical protein